MNAIQVNPKKEKTIHKKKQSPQSLHIILFLIKIIISIILSFLY